MNTILIATIALTSAFHATACEPHHTNNLPTSESKPAPIESVIERIELSAEQLLQSRLNRIASDKLFDAEATSRLGWSAYKTLQPADSNSLMLALHESSGTLPQ